jgi:hypothetical protein
MAWLIVGTSLDLAPALAEDPPEPYVAPLVGPFALSRSYRRPDADGSHISVVRKLAPDSNGHEIIVEHIEEVAVYGANIVGRCRAGYFVLNTLSDPEGRPTPAYFATAAEWRNTLAVANVPQDVKLQSPDAIAAGLPDRTIHPWDYRTMGGMLGWSDGWWSFVAQLFGYFLVFLIGLCRKGGSLVMPSIVVGWFFVDGIAYTLIGGGGPGMLFGLFLFPIVCGVAGLLGRGVRTFAKWMAH